MSQPAEDSTTSRQGERITVNLTETNRIALADGVSATGESKTAIINKALQLYALAQLAQSRKGGVYIRDWSGAELERLHLL